MTPLFSCLLVMKVFRIELGRPSGKRFSYYAALVADEVVWDFLFSVGEPFMGVPFGRKWKTQTFYYEKSLLPRSDFEMIGPSAFICNERARDLAASALEPSGQFLPVRVEGEKGKYWIYNITNTINVVDQKKSRWVRLGRGVGARMLEKPAFKAERFGEESLFKIPEDRGASMYCLEITGDASDNEFKAIVEKEGLTGLSFNLMWTEK
jgi:hypothetical protein